MMVSKTHQFMLSLVAIKMRSIGFEPIAYDGDSHQIGTIKLNIPPTIQNHRPDIVGMNQNNKFCIGEVKTENDISSKRTKQQLIDFSQKYEFIICTNKQSYEKLIKKLDNLGLL